MVDPGKWNWELPAVRAQLTPGTDLLDWDCALWTVKRVEEHGAVLENWCRLVETSDPERQHLVGQLICEEQTLTWAEMNKKDMFIYTGE